MADPAITEIREKLQSDDYGMRGYALQSLLNMVKRNVADRSVATELFRAAAAKEPHPYPAKIAIRGIEYLDGAQAARPYWIAMLRSTDPQVAAQAAMAVTDPAYFSELVELLDRWQDGEIQSTVIRALGRLKEPAAFPVITQRLSDQKLRPHAVEALGDLCDPRAIAYLEPLLHDNTPGWPIDNHGPMLFVRDLAAIAIQQIRGNPMPHQHAIVAPTLPTLPSVQTRIVIPPPLPHKRRPVQWSALIPIMAAGIEIPWVLMAIILLAAQSQQQRASRSNTHLFDVLAMVPAIIGALVGVYAAAGWSKLSLLERVLLVLGIVLCGLIMIPFIQELSH